MFGNSTSLTGCRYFLLDILRRVSQSFNGLPKTGHTIKADLMAYRRTRSQKGQRISRCCSMQCNSCAKVIVWYNGDGSFTHDISFSLLASCKGKTEFAKMKLLMQSHEHSELLIMCQRPPVIVGAIHCNTRTLHLGLVEHSVLFFLCTVDGWLLLYLLLVLRASGLRRPTYAALFAYFYARNIIWQHPVPCILPK